MAQRFHTRTPTRVLCRMTDSTEGAASFVASTALVDRNGNYIRQNWRLDNYLSNPVVLHEHEIPVVGRGEARVDGEGDQAHLIADVVWDSGEHNPIGTMVAVQHARGFRSAVSVRALPGTATFRDELDKGDPLYDSSIFSGAVIDSPELLEISSVAIPANPKALRNRWGHLGDQDDHPGEWAGAPDKMAKALSEIASRQAAEWIVAAIRADDAVRAAIRSILLEAGPAPEPEPSDFLTTLGI